MKLKELLPLLCNNYEVSRINEDRSYKKKEIPSDMLDDTVICIYADSEYNEHYEEVGIIYIETKKGR